MKNKMKTMFFAFLMAVLSVFLCNAAMAAGNIKVNEKIIDLGTVEEGPRVDVRVDISNTGDAPFSITNIRTSCACTTCKLPKNEIIPGETITMEIVYDTFKFPGKFDKTIHIKTDIPDHAEEVIHLVGHVNPMPMGVIELAERKIELKNLEAGSPSTVKIVFKNAGDAPYTVTKIYSSKAETVYFEGEITLASDESKELEITVVPDKSGRFLDIIWIVSEDARNTSKQGYKAILLGEVQ